MFVKEICRIGYFDRVVFDGYILPLYNDTGIEIKQDQSLIKAIEDNNQAFNQGIARLRINIAGESINNKDSINEVARMRKHREKELKLQRFSLGNIDRYYIGYADLLIVKADSLLPKLLEHKGKTEEDILKISNNEYQSLILSSAIEIQSKLMRESEDNTEQNVAILDKVYVHSNFRRCGISKWLQENLHDLIRIYGLVDVGAVLLIPGDFSDESSRQFNMSKIEYEQLLAKHYRNSGYKIFKDTVMYKIFRKRKSIFNSIDLKKKNH